MPKIVSFICHNSKKLNKICREKYNRHSSEILIKNTARRFDANKNYSATINPLKIISTQF